MDLIKLNKENPEIEFQLNAEDSYLLIQSIFVTSQINTGNQLSDFISKVNLSAELKYVIYNQSEKRFIDERKEQFKIPLPRDPNQNQPVFPINKLIKNDTFTLGINPARKFYNILKLELQNVENLDENYNIEINIEKCKMTF